MRQSIIDRFQEYLNSRGMRVTLERMLVLQTVAALTSPFSAETVVALLSGNPQKRVSRATVFRSLLALVEAEILVRNDADDDGILFTFLDDLSPLCREYHKNLIAGKCPWCGRTIINGAVE